MAAIIASVVSKANRADAILKFWFPVDAATGTVTTKHWWVKNNDFDQTIRTAFAADWQFATAGEYDDWMDSAQGSLALVVLFDQFPRNMFRGNAGMFASDPLALKVTLNAIGKGFDAGMTHCERQLLYMPLMHSESMEIHETYALEKFKSIDALEFEIKHFDIIRKWGRYPHRNALLGRESTPEEIEFLKEEGSSF